MMWAVRIRAGYGVGVITVFIDTENVSANLLSPIVQLKPDDPITPGPIRFDSGTWTVTVPVQQFYLPQLAGFEITGLADGQEDHSAHDRPGRWDSHAIYAAGNHRLLSACQISRRSCRPPISRPASLRYRGSARRLPRQRRGLSNRPRSRSAAISPTPQCRAHNNC